MQPIPRTLFILQNWNSISRTHFILQNWNSIPIKQKLPVFPIPLPLTATILLSVSMNLTVLGVSLEKEMATHSSILALRIPWTEEPGGLLYIRLHRVRHDWSDLACMHWRRKWQPTPVFLPGESQGQRSLYGVTQSWTQLKLLSSSSSSRYLLGVKSCSIDLPVMVFFSLSIMSSSFIQVVACVRISFLFKAK